MSDAEPLAGIADGAILLIQHRRNPASMVLRAQQTIAGLKTPILGAVLTQVPAGSGEDYGYYTRNYEYYGEDGKRRPRAKTPEAKGPGGRSHGAERIGLNEPDPRDGP